MHIDFGTFSGFALIFKEGITVLFKDILNAVSFYPQFWLQLFKINSVLYRTDGIRELL
jgi:hypothetical protein